MIYLIGVNHIVQHSNPTKHAMTQEFITYVGEVVKKYKIKAIFDEWMIGVPDISHVETISNNFSISYTRINPNKAWYDENHIPLESDIIRSHPEVFSLPHWFRPGAEERFLEKEEAKYFPIREAFWFEKMKDKLNTNVLVICGTSHISTMNKHVLNNQGFDLLLKSKEYNVTILPKRFDGN